MCERRGVGSDGLNGWRGKGILLPGFSYLFSLTELLYFERVCKCLRWPNYSLKFTLSGL